MKPIEILRKELKIVTDLRGASSLLQWDQETYMPDGAGAIRAEQIALLDTLSHEHLVGDLVSGPLGELVDLDTGEQKGGLPDEESRLVQEIWKDYHRAIALPKEFVEEYSQTTSMAQQIWAQARKENSFSKFAPILEKVIKLKFREIDYLGVKTTPYDILLDYFEPGMTSADVTVLFDAVKERLIPLVQKIATSGVDTGVELLRRDYDVDKQWDFGVKILEDMGYDLNIGRQDKSAHPFTTSFHPTDVRITTRFNKNNLLSALSSTIHEGGHALYEQGMDQEWYGTPFCDAISYGIHESQSRLWENLVGLSKPFWSHYFPHLQKVFPENLSNISLDDFYRAVNTIEPSLIRVEADEATYNLHIMLRFEIEKLIINDRIPVAALPELWNDKMEEYLGVRPDTDAEGVLQDVHWSFGGFGYFPTYALGNLYNVPIYNQAQNEIEDLDIKIASGNLIELRNWLGEKVYRVGRRRTAAELIVDISGKKLSADPFMDYLEDKYKEVYSL